MKHVFQKYLVIVFAGFAVSQDCPIPQWFFPYGSSVGDSISYVDNDDGVMGFFPIRSGLHTYRGEFIDTDIDTYYELYSEFPPRIVINATVAMEIRIPDMSLEEANGAQSAVFYGKRTTQHALHVINKAVNDILQWGEVHAPFVADVAAVFTFHCHGNQDHEKSIYQITVAFSDTGTFIILNFSQLYAMSNFDGVIEITSWGDISEPLNLNMDWFILPIGPQGYFDFLTEGTNGIRPGQWIVAVTNSTPYMPDLWSTWSPWWCLECGGCGQRVRFVNGLYNGIAEFEYGACGHPIPCTPFGVSRNRRREYVWVTIYKRLRRARRCCYDFRLDPPRELAEPVRCSLVNGWSGTPE